MIEASALAVITRSGATMFGITLECAGSKNAAPMVSRKSSGYTSQTIAGVRTASIPSTTKKRATSAPIMMRLRLMRSLSTPAVGAASVLGSTCSTTASPTDCALLPVRSSSRL